MESKRFDRLSRQIGAQTDRRRLLTTAAGGALALLGLGVFGRPARGQEVSAESNGYQGDTCDTSQDCKKGLRCNQNKGKCEYKNNCGGKKGDACQNSGDCCNGRNLKCQNKKCKRDKK